MRCSSFSVTNTSFAASSEGTPFRTVRCMLPAGHDGFHITLNDDGESYTSWSRSERDDVPLCWCAVCNPGAWWLIVCPMCQSKRCPRAASHLQACRRGAE